METVPLWGRWEQVLRVAGEGAGDDAAQATELTVELTAPSGKTAQIFGFWDGDSTWRIRFMPVEAGEWKYRTRSHPSRPGLDGIEGTFPCRESEVSEAGTPFARHGAVQVSADGHCLQHADGSPFFWLGDTVWSGPALSETLEDWDFYLRTRREQRFTVTQFNAVSPWRVAPTDAEGRTSFTGKENIQINPAFFQRLDRYMDAINERGLLAAPVLLWSLKSTDAGSYLSEEDCIRLIRYQVARYQGHHVLWILAGDNPYNDETAEKWKRIGRAVFGTGKNPFQAPATTHPTGQNWPWETWRDESWLTVLGYQSGHGDNENSMLWLHSGPPHQNWQKLPARPIINMEPPYEGHYGYATGLPHTDRSVRRAVYWSLLTTRTAGVTYGAQGIWSWHTKEGEPPTDHPGAGIAPHWRDALNMPGGNQMGYVADLFESLDWWDLRPADEILLEQPGTHDPAKYVSVSRTGDGRTVVAYLPAGGAITLAADSLPEPYKAEWFSPRDGARRLAEPNLPGAFAAPDAEDWVLILRYGA